MASLQFLSVDVMDKRLHLFFFTESYSDNNDFVCWCLQNQLVGQEFWQVIFVFCMCDGLISEGEGCLWISLLTGIAFFSPFFPCATLDGQVVVSVENDDNATISSPILGNRCDKDVSKVPKYFCLWELPKSNDMRLAIYNKCSFFINVCSLHTLRARGVSDSNRKDLLSASIRGASSSFSIYCRLTYLPALKPVIRHCKKFLSAWIIFVVLIVDCFCSTWKREENIRSLFFGDVFLRKTFLSTPTKSFFYKLHQLILAFIVSHQRVIFNVLVTISFVAMFWWLRLASHENNLIHLNVFRTLSSSFRSTFCLVGLHSLWVNALFRPIPSHVPTLSLVP